MKEPPTSTSPDTAKAKVRGVRSPRGSRDDAAAVDCWAGGVPEDDAGVAPEDAVGVMEPVVTLDRSELNSELGIGVSPGGMPIDPSEIAEVTPPVCYQQGPHVFVVGVWLRTWCTGFHDAVLIAG